MRGVANVPILLPACCSAAVIKSDIPSQTNSIKDEDSINPPKMTVASKSGWMHKSDLFGTQIIFMSALNELCGETTEKEPSLQENNEEEASTSTIDKAVPSALMGCVLDPMLVHAFAISNPNEKIIGAQCVTTPALVSNLQKFDNIKGADKERCDKVLQEINESHFVDVVPVRFDDETRISQHMIFDAVHSEPRRSKEFIPLVSIANDCGKPLGQVMIVQSKWKEQLISIDSREPSITPRSEKNQDIFITKNSSINAQKSTRVAQRHKWLQAQAFGYIDGVEKECHLSSLTKKAMDSKVRTVADKFGGAVSRQSVILQRKQQWENKWVVKKPQDGTDEKPTTKARWEVCNGAYKKKIVLESNQNASE